MYLQMTRCKIRPSIKNVLAELLLEGDLGVVLNGVNQPRYLHNKVEKPGSLYAPHQPDHVVIAEWK